MSTKVLVYHADEEIFRDSMMYRFDGEIFDTERALDRFYHIHVLADDKSGYSYVGEVYVDDYHTADDIPVLERAWFKTQNLEEHWNKTKPCRSTSIGDIFKIDNKVYIVASCGFDLLEG